MMSNSLYMYSKFVLQTLLWKNINLLYNIYIYKNYSVLYFLFYNINYKYLIFYMIRRKVYSFNSKQNILKKNPLLIITSCLIYKEIILS